jgi:hypothetical protein
MVFGGVWNLVSFYFHFLDLYFPWAFKRDCDLLLAFNLGSLLLF